MQELEKILEEIKGLIEKHKNKAYELVAREPLTQCYTEADIEQIKVHELAVVRDIIRKHMNDKSETYAFDFANTESFDCPCGRHYVHLAIPPKLEFCEKCKEKVRNNRTDICPKCRKNYTNMRKI
ncbi:MAG: hypothetical protein ACLTUZ_08600 [Sellimonas intestinalis]|uniref:hypothetical protein n=1 Tax=Sellimonas intestinalis TaxID=1653434 RepID=UPI003991FFB8